MSLVTVPMEPKHPMVRQCTAKSKQSGVRCKRYPIPGGTVCVMHGGKAPLVQEAAKLRLLAAADPVAAKLIELALGKKAKHSDQLAAIRDILDRTGHKAADAGGGGGATVSLQLVVVPAGHQGKVE